MRYINLRFTYLLSYFLMTIYIVYFAAVSVGRITGLHRPSICLACS